MPSEVSSHRTFQNKQFIFSNVALILISCFAAAVVALHFIRTDYDPLLHFISEYESGSWGVLMHIAFFCLGAGSLFIAILLWLAITKPARSVPAFLFLLLWSLCVCAAGIFKADIKGAAETTAGKIHNQVSLLGFIAVIASSFYWLKFRVDDNWKRFYSTSLLLSVIMAIMFALMMISVITDFLYVGLVQRFFVVSVLLWLISMAQVLRYFNKPV